MNALAHIKPAVPLAVPVALMLALAASALLWSGLHPIPGGADMATGTHVLRVAPYGSGAAVRNLLF